MGFDLRTQKLNKKGQVVLRQPYRLYIEKGMEKFERPPGSGNFFSRDGEPIVKKGRQAAAEAKQQKAKDWVEEKDSSEAAE